MIVITDNGRYIHLEERWMVEDCKVQGLLYTEAKEFIERVGDGIPMINDEYADLYGPDAMQAIRLANPRN